MDNQLNFAACAQLLRAAGYCPAPIGDYERPVGPFAVMQIHYDNFPSNADLAVAVLTGVPPARGPYDPVQNAPDTWLAQLVVKVRTDLLDEVDTIVKRHAGDAKCPARIADGAVTYVFRLEGAHYPTINTAPYHAPDMVRAITGPGFIPLNGDWKGNVTLLDFQCHELAALSGTDAQAIIKELDTLLDARAPAPVPAAPYVPRPILALGQSLRWNNSRALAQLQENGFTGLVPVKWGSADLERNGYNDFMGQFRYSVDVSTHGVACSMRGFALVEFGSRTIRSDVDELIRSFGHCLSRTVAGDNRPAFLFKSDARYGGGDSKVGTASLPLTIRRTGLLILSGTDARGREYKWNSDLLATKVDSLGSLEASDARRLEKLLEQLPIDYSQPASKKRRA